MIRRPTPTDDRWLAHDPRPTALSRLPLEALARDPRADRAADRWAQRQARKEATGGAS